MVPVRAILVPMDFSSHSDAALDRAVGLAKTFGASIHLLHSYAVPLQGVMPYDFAVPDGVWMESARRPRTSWRSFDRRSCRRVWRPAAKSVR